MASAVSPAKRYAEGVLSYDVPTESHRLRLRERLMDPLTKAIVTERGVRPSWRCLEAGAGAGSIAYWLAENCPEGRVVATDVDVRHLDTSATPNLKAIRHDIVLDDFPPASFDLIHARSLLVNLPEREAVLAKMVNWLAPGGWLVLEEPAHFHIDSTPYPAFRRLMEAFERAVFLSHGADTRWSRHLPAWMAGTGLTDLGMRLSAHYVGDGGLGEEIWRIFLEQARAGILEHGLLSESEFAEGLALFDDPAFVEAAVVFVAAWARRPAG